MAAFQSPLRCQYPQSPHKSIILTACYAVVLFSIIIQGLTIERVAKRVTRERQE